MLDMFDSVRPSHWLLQFSKHRYVARGMCYWPLPVRCLAFQSWSRDTKMKLVYNDSWKSAVWWLDKLCQTATGRCAKFVSASSDAVTMKDQRTWSRKKFSNLVRNPLVLLPLLKWSSALTCNQPRFEEVPVSTEIMEHLGPSCVTGTPTMGKA